jgi:hypothetical protein
MTGQQDPAHQFYGIFHRRLHPGEHAGQHGREGPAGRVEFEVCQIEVITESGARISGNPTGVLHGGAKVALSRGQPQTLALDEEVQPRILDQVPEFPLGRGDFGGVGVLQSQDGVHDLQGLVVAFQVAQAVEQVVGHRLVAGGHRIGEGGLQGGRFIGLLRREAGDRIAGGIEIVISQGGLDQEGPVLHRFGGQGHDASSQRHDLTGANLLQIGGHQAQGLEVARPHAQRDVEGQLGVGQVAGGHKRFRLIKRAGMLIGPVTLQGGFPRQPCPQQQDHQASPREAFEDELPAGTWIEDEHG